MIPLIISSSIREDIDKYLKENHFHENVFYLVNITGKSIGIDDIKALQAQTKFANDQNSVAVFIIEDGQKMTHAAQNALLKTLEESRPEQQFIITADNYQALLPTIISRCRVINLHPRDTTAVSTEITSEILRSLTGPINDLLSLTEKIITHDQEKVLHKTITLLHQANRKHPTVKRTKVINLFSDCLSNLKANVNPRLAIDHCLLKSNAVVKMNRERP